MSNKLMWNNLKSGHLKNMSQVLEYYRPCPICNSLKNRSLMCLEDFQFYSDSKTKPKHFTIRNVQCLDCHAVFLNPCYSDYGFKVLFEEAGKSYGSLSEHTEEQITWLKQNNLLKKDFKILDVGCYDGEFLSQLPITNYKYGVDIDKKAIERGLKKHGSKGIKLYCEDFKSFNNEGVSPDTVTMYHVLEHLTDPVGVLKKICQIAHADTKLVIEVPVLDNGNTNDIHGFFSIQHTTHFSKLSLYNCLENSGWKVVKEYRTKDYNGLRVVCSPKLLKKNKSVKHNHLIDWNDINSSLTSWRGAIEGVERIIQNIPKSEKYVIWGAGIHTEYLFNLTSLFHSKSSEFIIVDSDELKQQKTWRGLKIFDTSIIKQIKWENTSLVISSYGSQNIIYDAATKLDVPESCIFKLYESIRRY